MNTGTWIARSLRFYWRAHTGVVLGAALSTMVITGALAVGDSVKAGLRRISESRLGKVRLALAAQDRFFRAQLAEDLALGAQAAPALILRGTAARPDGEARGGYACGSDHARYHDQRDE